MSGNWKRYRFERRIRRNGPDEVDGIGVDAEGDLYWQGKRVQTRARLDLNWRQTLYAVIIAIFTVIGGCGAAVQGWTAYHDWACKVGWRAVSLPSRTAATIGQPLISSQGNA